MSRSFSFVLALALGGSASFLVACGTSASSLPPSDASTGDVTSGPTGDASSADANDDGPTEATEDGATEDAPNPSVCLAQPANACIDCCANLYPAGYEQFGKIELACACAPSLCGPPDGGADAATDGAADAGTDGGPSDAGADDGAAPDAGGAGGSDGGPLGNAACAATCTSYSSPDQSCVTCIRATLGSESAPGPCGLTVLAGCITETDCSPYFSCIEQCPN